MLNSDEHSHIIYDSHTEEEIDKIKDFEKKEFRNLYHNKSRKNPKYTLMGYETKI